MKILDFFLIASFAVLSFSSYADGSFRLKSGKLLSTGSSKSEVIILVGSPIYEEEVTKAVDIGIKNIPVKVDILTYKLEGSIGGMYAVTVTIHNSKVVSVESKQVGRL